jgi:hypothetical protein
MATSPVSLSAADELVLGARLVVALASQVGHQLVEATIDLGLPVRLARRQAQPRGDAVQRFRRVAVHRDLADAKARPCFHVDDQRAARGARQARSRAR